MAGIIRFPLLRKRGFFHTYLDHVSLYPVDTKEYWQENALINAEMLKRQDSISPMVYAMTAPVVQDLARLLAEHRERRKHA